MMFILYDEVHSCIEEVKFYVHRKMENGPIGRQVALFLISFFLVLFSYECMMIDSNEDDNNNMYNMYKQRHK